MTDWITPVARALDSVDVARPIFFRDDDAGWDDRALLALLDEFTAAAIVVDVAAIPAALSKRTADDLAARAAAGTVRVHQHGYAHVDHEPQGRKCEFGQARSPAAQAADVRAGRRRLEDLLGRRIDPVFTPPWNRCTAATADAAAAAGHRVLSRDQSAGGLDHQRLVDLPVNVDWSARRKGQPVTAEHRGQVLAAAVLDGGPVGVMLHHATLDAAELRDLRRLLDLVASSPGASPATILDIAQGRVGG